MPTAIESLPEINMVVAETIALVAALIYIAASWPAMPHAVWIGIALAVIMPIAFYPFSRTCWLARDLSFGPASRVTLLAIDLTRSAP